MLYIYIYSDSALREAGGLPPNRRGFWIGFGEVFGYVLERFLDRV